MSRSQRGLINKNMTIFTMSSKLLVCLSVYNQIWFDSTALLAGVPLEELDYCIQGQGHSEGSKC